MNGNSPEPSTKGTTHRIAGLFAGIGGLELGLSESGHEAALLCEWDSTAAHVLKTRFDAVRLHDDVRTLESVPRGTTLITAGFPCQDLSQAGKTAGIEGARSGLVGEVFRLIDDRRIPWVLLENVPFMLQLAGGQAMDVIASAFEARGYRWAYRVVDSRTFGLPQRRRRVYFLASHVGDPREILFADKGRDPNEEDRGIGTAPCGFYWTEGIRGLGWAVDSIPTLKGGSTIGIPSSPAIVFPDGRVVTPNIRDAERLQGFAADWTKPAEEVSRPGLRWKLVGNAVSVPAAAWIGRRMKNPGAVSEFELTPLDSRRRWPSSGWNVGEGRTAVDASEWPIGVKWRSLSEFLKYSPALLSERATRGFLSRAEKSSLRFPDGLLDSLRVHVRKMQSEDHDRRSSANTDCVRVA